MHVDITVRYKRAPKTHPTSLRPGTLQVVTPGISKGVKAWKGSVITSKIENQIRFLPLSAHRRRALRSADPPHIISS